MVSFHTRHLKFELNKCIHNECWLFKIRTNRLLFGRRKCLIGWLERVDVLIGIRLLAEKQVSSVYVRISRHCLDVSSFQLDGDAWSRELPCQNNSRPGTYEYPSLFLGHHVRWHSRRPHIKVFASWIDFIFRRIPSDAACRVAVEVLVISLMINYAVGCVGIVGLRDHYKTSVSSREVSGSMPMRNSTTVTPG